jgi:dUTP pyrophosphatase
MIRFRDIQMKIEKVNKSKHRLRQYSTEASAGMHLRVDFDIDGVLQTMKKVQLLTGLFREISIGYKAQKRLRKSLAVKSSISILNPRGTINADFIGVVC